jgi:hypothetical protein
MLVGEIQIKAAVLLGAPHVNTAPRRIELSLGFERIKSRPERRWRWGSACRVVVAAPEPRPEPEAAHWPGFPVTVDHEIGKGGAVRCMEQLRAGSRFEKHGRRR